MAKPLYEVAQVVENQWSSILNKDIKLNSWQIRTLNAIKVCRTSEIGGHIDHCSSCGHFQLSYNSCRNRHCPKCQSEKRNAWIEARKAQLLPVKYFHVVFTLPHCINSLAIYNPKVVYNLLFSAAWKTIQAFSEDHKWVGGKMGMTAILHTWGQNLSLHPHLHCIVPGGGLTQNGTWKTIKSSSKILFPVKAMSKVFRGKYVAALKKEIPDVSSQLINQLYQHKWVVYAKQPFGGPKQVIEYLGRYSHKIAISNHRITNISKGQISFKYKDYKKGGVQKTMTLSQSEFIRRFAMHILPKRYIRIRHYGILSSTWKREKLKNLQQALDFIPPQPKTSVIKHQCPKCNMPTWASLITFDKRGPPLNWKTLCKNNNT